MGVCVGDGLDLTPGPFPPGKGGLGGGGGTEWAWIPAFAGMTGAGRDESRRWGHRCASQGS